jgi:hypothetical protein
MDDADVILGLGDQSTDADIVLGQPKVPKVIPLTTKEPTMAPDFNERRMVGPVPVPLAFSEKPTPPGPVSKAVGGLWESTIGGLGQILKDAADKISKGDLPGLTQLATSLGLGGLVTVDPSKGITEGGITSETGRNLVEAGKNLVSGKPATTVTDLVESLPYIGPMIEVMNKYLAEGEVAKGLGFGAGIVAGAKVGGAVHSSIKQSMNEVRVINAARKVSEEIKADPEIAKDPARVSELVEKIANEEIVKEDTKAKNIEANKKVKATRVRTPEQIEADKAKMIKVRKAKAAKLPIQVEQPKSGTLAQPTPENPLKGIERETTQPEQITEVDLQTGFEEPFSEMANIFDADRDAVNARTEVYAKNGTIANSVDEALASNITAVKDISTTGWKLANDINRWKLGEEIDIEGTRNFLSEIATRSDEFVGQFESLADFTDWKDTVSEMASWARKTDHLKSNRTIAPDIRAGEVIPEKVVGSADELMVTGADFDAMEKFYGKSLDEISDAEIKSFMRERPKAEAKIVAELPEEDFTPEELAELETPDKVELKKPKKEINWTPEQKAELDELVGKGKAKPEISELDKLIQEQSEDQAVTERFSRRRRTRTSLNFGLPLDEAGRIMKDWYSALRTYAEEKLGNKASGQQIKATLRKGSTQDEWKTVNLDELLEDGKTYTKEEVLRKIDEGTVEFKDVVLGEPENLTEYNKFVARMNEKYGNTWSEQDLTTQEKVEWKTTNASSQYQSPKFKTYQEPGGSNYRELFVTAPNDILKDPGIAVSDIKRYFGISDVEWENFKPSRQAELSAEFEYRDPYRTRPNSWQDGHSDYSDIENPIVRLRMNDRYTPDPNGKSFQAKDGQIYEYQEGQPFKLMEKQGGQRVSKVLFLEELQGPSQENQAKMPESLRKRIREIGMKRAIKYAIDNGYDKVAWTTGEMQAKRYSLGGTYNDVSIGQDKYGYWLQARDSNNDIRFDRNGLTEKGLAEHIGVELASKAISDIQNGKSADYTGQDLNLGGQGLRKLYDQDLHNVAKKLGGKVEDTTISLKTSPDFGENYRNEPEAQAIAEIAKARGNVSVPSISVSPLKAKAQKGFTLYSGVPLDKLAEAAKASLDLFDKAFDKAHEMKALNLSKVGKAFKEEFNRAILDRSGNIRVDLLDKLGDKGYNIIQRMYLSKGASARASAALHQMRKEVYSGFSKSEKAVLDKLILATRMVDIGKYKNSKQFKFPEGQDPETSSLILQTFEKRYGLSPERALQLQNATKAYFEWMKKPLKEMFDGGLISEKEYSDLVSHNYRRIGTVDSPTTLASILDKKNETLSDSKRTIYDSGIERLARGQESDIYEPSSEIMALETFNRAYGRIMNNRANKALLDLARSDPNNMFVRTKENEGKIPSGFTRFFVYEAGERKSIWLSPEMSKEWINTSRDITPQLARMLRIGSLSNVTRTFATGIEWSFALANLPRDIMHSWFAARTFENGKWTSVYSPVLPVFMGQMGRDLATVFSDSVMRKGRWNDYINDGGGMDFLVHQARPFQKGLHLEGPVEKVYNVLGYFGETSEVLTRLAIRERVLRKGKSAQEATFAARDYMDFAQGGWFTKTADNVIPYLNASVVGTRGLLRSFKGGTGLQSTFKLMQFGSVVIGIYLASKNNSPKTAEAVKNDLAGQNNLIIPLGDQFGFEDEKGQIRYPYFKIPLDPGQKFFKKFLEATTDKWLGEEIDVDGTVNALGQVSPVGISSLPPTLSGALGYMMNKDFWKNEDIWKQTDKTFSYPQSKEEYTSKTSSAYKDIGAVTGLSPERTKYVVNELVANSMWGDLVGGAYEKAFGDMPKVQKERHLAEVLSKTTGLRRFIGLTNPYSQYQGKASEIEQENTLKVFTENRNLDMRVEGFIDKSVSYKEVMDFIYSHNDKSVRDRMKEEFKFAQAAKGLPNLSFWMRMKGLPTVEARAEFYLYRFNKLDKAGKAQLFNEERQVSRMGGILTPEFKKELNKLRMK